MSKADLITEGVQISKGTYRCPWQSITFITAKVDGALRHDGIYSDKELLEIPLNKIMNDIKMQLYKLIVRKRTKGLITVASAIDPNRLEYNGWTTRIKQAFIHTTGKRVQPFRQGFAIATKNIQGTTLNVVSIAVFINSKDY